MTDLSKQVQVLISEIQIIDIKNLILISVFRIF